MKKVLYSLVFVASVMLTCQQLSAQDTKVTISGRVLENSQRVPVEYATVLVKSMSDDKLLEGTTTNAEGRFEIQCALTDLYVEISFIGFATKAVTGLKPKNGRISLGDILLEQENTTLDEVVVEGERSQTEFHLDKRVFNVGQDLSSSGSSALEVLNHVPSVNVSIEGRISLRGSQGVRILINGKPSVLAGEQGNALGTITADMIERIEVITNPSAKYDAAGTSGIINIVLKKEDKNGINGSVTVNVGVPNNHSLGFSLNRRTEKVNLFTQLGIGHRTFPLKQRTIIQDEADGSTITSGGEREKNETFYNVILGTDYHFSKTSQLSLAGHFAYETETEYGTTRFTSVDGVDLSDSEWKRSESTAATNPKWAYDLQYQKHFKGDKEHELLMTALGNFFGKDQHSDYTNVTLSGGNSGGGDQRTETDFAEAEYTFKTDYTRPISEKFKFEAGAQYQVNDLFNDYSILRPGGETWVPDPNLTNKFEMDQRVLAGYSIGSYEDDKFGVKLGVRVEGTTLDTRLVNNNEDNSQRYTNLFPTAHTSYKFSKKFSVQAGYSRRIYRPDIWQLNPFLNIQNNYLINTGNPHLQPEFTDAMEATAIINLKAVSLNAGVFHRYTTDAIERFSTMEDNVSIMKPVNTGEENTTGVEMNAKFTPTEWMTLATDFNLNRLAKIGIVENSAFDFSTSQWNARVTTRFKLPADIDFEVMGRYRSSYETIQGQMSDNYAADLGVRKKIVKGKAIVNLSIRDVFASSVQQSDVYQSGHYLYDWRKQGRFITIGLSYGFGKGEAMEFSGQKRF
ncbi:MAG: TonB-dependent receptor family protein [Bacteroidota bacterium]|nr:TonB-dependent receptor family protein [Bacteroidota bacterium]